MSKYVKDTRFDRSTLAVCAAILAAAVLAVTSTWSGATEPAKSTPMHSTAAPMDHSKMGGMKHMEGMSMTGDVDYDFAANMRMHHQMGVSMARAQVKHGKNPQMLLLAREIITAQNKEIAQIDLWVKAHKKAVGMAAPKTK